MKNQFFLEITKESGEVIHSEEFNHEVAAHDKFEELEKIKSPLTYLTYTMNLSEYYTAGGTIGSVRVVALIDDKSGMRRRYERRELYRSA